MRTVLLVVCLASLAAPAAGGEPLDLERVVTLALEQNPALQATAERRDQVAGGVEEARADAYPEITLVSSWSRSRNPALLNSPDFHDIVDLIPDFRPAEQELWDLGVEVQQKIYTGGKIRAALDLAGLVADITEAQIRSAELDTALTAAEAYYRLLASRHALATVSIQERAREASLEVVEARFELGEATRLEQLRARSALAEIRPAIVAIQGRIDVEASRLRRALGLAADAALEPVDVFADEPDPFAPPPALAALLDFARGHRPELVDLRLQAEALGRQKTLTLADGRPQVELDGLYGRQVRLPENFDDDLYANWRATFSLRWSVFDGRRRKGQVAQLDSRADQLRWQLRDLESAIESEIAAARVELETARARHEATVLAARAAAEARRVASESYGEGVALQADLLAAQEQETQAELARVEAFFEARIRAARLLRALGLLPTESWSFPEGSS